MEFDNIKNIDLKQARDIVRYAFMYDDETIELAFTKIEALAPAEADEKKRSEMEELLKSKDLERMELRIQKAKEILNRPSEKGGSVKEGSLEKAKAFLDEVDTYEGPDEIKDSATAEKNYDALKASLDALEEKDEEGNPKWLAIVKEYTDKVDFTKDGKDVDEEQRKIALETLWRTTKTNILVAHTLDWEWMKKFNEKDADKEAMIKEEVEDYYALAVMKAHEAEKIRAPEGKENEVGSEEYIKYMEEISRNSVKTLKDFLAESKEKIKIGMDKIVAGAAHAWAEVDSLANHLDIKGYATSLLNKVKEYRNEFGKWMSANHPETWEKMKGIAVNFKANKHQMIGNLVATGAYSVATVAAFATGNGVLFAVATKAYAGYMAAGSAIWPAFQKRHIEREQARKRGEDVTKWTGLKGLGNAMGSILSNKHEAIGYSAKVIFGTAAAALTFGIANSSVAQLGLAQGVDALTNKAKFMAATKGARFMSSVVRASASVMSQVSAWAVHGVTYAFKPNEINKAYFEQSKTGLKWALGMAAASITLQSFSLGHSGSADANGLVEGANGGADLPPAEGANGGADLPPAEGANGGVAEGAEGATEGANGGVAEGAEGATEGANGGVAEGAEGAAEGANGGVAEGAEGATEGANGGAAEGAADTNSMVESLRIPTEYNEAMGITEDQWERIRNDITGIYKDHADIFDLENKSSEETLAYMYQNIANAKNVNPDLFKDLSHVDVNELQGIMANEEGAGVVSKLLGIKAEKINDLIQNNPDAIQKAFAEVVNDQTKEKANLFGQLYGMNPDLFDKDMTTEQVLYKYMMTIEYTERTKPGPEGFLITRLDKEGLPLYWTRQKETRLLNDIILCGNVDEIDAETAGTLSADIQRIADNGHLTGEGHNIGVTNNSFAGARGDGTDCTDTYQNAWRKGEDFVQKHEPPATETHRADGTVNIVDIHAKQNADGNVNIADGKPVVTVAQELNDEAGGKTSGSYGINNRGTSSGVKTNAIPSRER